MTGKIMTRRTKTHRRAKPGLDIPDPDKKPLALFRVSKHGKAKQPQQAKPERTPAK